MRFQRFFCLPRWCHCSRWYPASICGQSQPAAATKQPAAESAPPPPPRTQAAPLANAKPAKVWTNDEIDTLRGNHGVSVVGNHTTQKVSATSKLYSQEKDPAWYRNQLAPLRAEIDKLDPEIAKLKAFLSGENVSDPSTMRTSACSGNPPGSTQANGSQAPGG